MKLRQIKTTAEMRAVTSAAEMGIKVRSKRNTNNLPSAYDDVKRGRRTRTDKYKNR